MSSSYYRVIKALWRSTKNMTVLTNTRPFSMEQAEEEEVPKKFFLSFSNSFFRFPHPRGPELAQSTSWDPSPSGPLIVPLPASHRKIKSVAEKKSLCYSDPVLIIFRQWHPIRVVHSGSEWAAQQERDWSEDLCGAAEHQHSQQDKQDQQEQEADHQDAVGDHPGVHCLLVPQVPAQHHQVGRTHGGVGV